ncbi:DUF1189 domain-containing protein [Metabacillus iocasae]|uniref:Nitrogen fixation-related uncharacterized protein n=1 Tax=Priestia iocasae TaxID=2291674 RepID=A0ABS2QR42_9BACI|nr:DUF1189 domain-containing protein [Metabacillus iocasae]MBM7701512.1 nitrogen fixation-related uncharacterized protein [Metabacillus iocasae]
MNAFHQLFYSLYSPKIVAMFRFQGIGKTISYLFLLTFLSLLPTMFFITQTVVNGYAQSKTILLTEIRDFSIQDDSLYSSMNEPLITSRNDTTFIFDSTGSITTTDTNTYRQAIGFLQDGLFITTNYSTQTYSYSLLQMNNLTKEEFFGIFDQAKQLLIILIPLALVLLYIVASGVKFIEVSLLAIVGLGLAKLLNRPLTYKHVWVMWAYSSTLMTLTFTLTDALHIMVPYSFFSHAVVTLLFLFFAMKRVPIRKQPTIKKS